MKIDKSKIRNPDEEYTYIWQQLNSLGNFFVWDVHPNVVKNFNIQQEKWTKKLTKLLASEEYKEYNPPYK